MGAEIDSLEIQIQANAARANQQLDSLVSKLNRLTTSLRSVEANGLSSMASGIQRLSVSMQSMKSVGTADFSRLSKNLDKMGAINASGIHRGANALSHMVQSLNGIGTINFDSSGIVNLANAINRFGSKTSASATANLPQIKKDLISFVQGLNSIGSIKFDMNGLANLVGSISKLGGKSATNSIPNIQQLGIALSQLMQTLSIAPRVNQNVIQMTNALANLASNGQRVGNAARGMVNSFSNYDRAARHSSDSTSGFASAIGMLYARFWMLKRAFSGLSKSTKGSMDYIETLNYFNVAFDQVGEDNISGWKQSGYDSAEAYINSFSERAKQMTTKLTGFSVEDDGTMVEAGIKNLGLDPNMIMNYQAQYAQMANSMGLVAKSSMNVSEALVMLGADWASLKNLDMDTSFKKMSSALSGQIRPARELGVDISIATLQTYALKYGLEGSVVAMNQATKVQLRMIAMLNQSKVAFGDMANTIGQPANQLRLLQQNFANLARAIGNIFLPIVATVLPYINALVIALRRLFTWIGSLLGVKMGDFSSSIGGGLSDMEDLAGGAGDLADNMGSAADNAKKMKGQLRGWDELNNLSSQDSSGGGSGGGGIDGGLLDDALEAELAAYQKAWDEAFARMENKAETFAKNIADYFKNIWDVAEPTRDALVRLWNEGLSLFGNFVWTGLKDFYSDFLVPLGKWTLGEGLPKFINITNEFLKSIDWDRINDSLRNFWSALEPFTENIGRGLLDFYKDLTVVGANFINSVVPDGLNSLSNALKKIKPDTVEKIGYGLGILSVALLGFEGIKKTASGIKLLSDSFGGFFRVAGVTKYTAIAMGIGAVILALDKFGYINVNWDVLASAFGKIAKALGKFAVGIGKGLITFFDGLLTVVSPGIELLINGAAKALDALGTILLSIPEGVISGLATTLTSFFLAFQTYKAVISVGGLIAGLTSNLTLLANVLPGIVNSGPILKNLAAALGPSALGGIQFTLIAGGLFALGSVIKKFYDDATDNPELETWASEFEASLDKIKQKSEIVSNALGQLKEDYLESGESQSAVAESLAQKYSDLHEKANPTAGDIALMKQYSKDLVDYYPEMEQYFNDETGLLDMNREAIQKVIDKQKEMAKVKASLSGLEESYRAEFEASKNLTQAKRDEKTAYDDLQKKYQEIYEYHEKHPVIAPGIFAGTEFEKLENDVSILLEAYNSAQQASSKAEETFNESTESIKYFSDEYDKSAKQIYDATPDFIKSFEDVGVSVEEKLSRKLQDSSSESVQAILDMFSQMKSGTIQSGEQLKSAFTALGIEMPESFIEALKNQSDSATQSELAQIFLDLGSGVQQSAESLKKIFHSVGLDLPDATIKGLSEKNAEVQKSTINLLGQIESGTGLREKELRDLFSGLGLDLSDTLAAALVSGGPGVQEDTIQLLSSISAGEKIKEQDLKDLFSKLGLDLPNELITSLQSKNPETLKQAIELITQIGAASDAEKPDLVRKLNELGSDGANNLNTGLGSKNEELKTTVSGMAKAVKETANAELDPGDKGATSMYNAGANASKGFWQGLKDLWDNGWLAKEIAKMKKTASGAEDLGTGKGSKVSALSVEAFAKGGFPNKGELFIANESGPEMVGRIGRRTAVANNDQITTAVSVAVENSMMQILPSFIEKTRSTFSGYQLKIPDTSYGMRNNSFADSGIDMASYNKSNNLISSVIDGIGEILNVSVEKMIDYDELARSFGKVHLTAELDSDKAWNSTKKNWNQDYKHSNNVPVPI